VRDQLVRLRCRGYVVALLGRDLILV